MPLEADPAFEVHIEGNRAIFRWLNPQMCGPPVRQIGPHVNDLLDGPVKRFVFDFTRATFTNLEAINELVRVTQLVRAKKRDPAFVFSRKHWLILEGTGILKILPVFSSVSEACARLETDDPSAMQ